MVYLPATSEAFDNCELNSVHWCLCSKRLSNAFSKNNRVTPSPLLEALRSGKHERPSEMTTTFGPTSYGNSD